MAEAEIRGRLEDELRTKLDRIEKRAKENQGFLIIILALCLLILMAVSS
jgi:hypothetical protein